MFLKEVAPTIKSGQLLVHPLHNKNNISNYNYLLPSWQKFKLKIYKLQRKIQDCKILVTADVQLTGAISNISFHTRAKGIEAIVIRNSQDFLMATIPNLLP